jgi:hypothetical protein
MTRVPMPMEELKHTLQEGPSGTLPVALEKNL